MCLGGAISSYAGPPSDLPPPRCTIQSRETTNIQLLSKEMLREPTVHSSTHMYRLTHSHTQTQAHAVLSQRRVDRVAENEWPWLSVNLSIISKRQATRYVMHLGTMKTLLCHGEQ